ncbi:SOS response-associated peptidase [Ornithinibacillus halotolerans]|uniref:Abasic site processing protein n=1 Tax=Ornithinibacillus halotolerans TaxID=1274357 RepID=A0A916SAP7_9BACI|nr:SOS response-associated peptidase [Ornithinibacillus halotolerans]GGA89070.1 putative SOS response-associated peptidase YoqW [Ornithinibacillus halotolerans]
MCGRYTMLADELEILDEFGIERDIQDFHKSYNVAPGQNVLAIIHDGKEKRAGYLRWGLVPSWARDEKIGYKMINARSESAHEKPSFKNLLSRKRCLIVADSFYEWKKNEDGTKQPKRIHVANRKLFAFAGLWDKWRHDEGDLFTCTILTRDANDFMQDIHHREPIILPKEHENTWIAPERMEPIEAHEFLLNVQMDPLSAYNVSSYVNAAKNNDEACIRALAD